MTTSVADVIVIGGGLAGFCAALSAAEAGAEVLLFEKSARYGGSTVLSAGGFAFAGTDAQREAGIKDSTELLRADLLKTGNNLNDANLVDLFVERQLDTYSWLVKHGVSFGSVILASSMSVPRGHPVDPLAMMNTLRQRIADDGRIKYFDNSPVTRILRGSSPEGPIAIRVERAGHAAELVARRGVVIATGGFTRNAALLERYAPNLRQALRSGGAVNTGDGFLMGLALGADHRDVGYIKGTFGLSLNSFPEIAPEADINAMLMISMYEGGIVVNATGRRFVNESISYKAIGDACLKQPRGIGFQIFDAKIMAKSVPIPSANDFNLAERRGLLRKADTICDLANELQIAPDVLVRTVQSYNDNVEAGEDREFGRKTLGGNYGVPPKIDAPPFYGFPCATSILATYCGLSVNRSMQLLNPFSEPLAGVFACGEVVGGLHGDNYLSGSALAKSAIFGRVAGESAARYKHSEKLPEVAMSA